MEINMSASTESLPITEVANKPRHQAQLRVRRNRSARRRTLKRISAFTLIEVMIVVNIMGILLVIATPSLKRARETSRTKACISNLRKIQGAKEQWAMEMRQPGTATPADASLFGAAAYLKAKPSCPSNTAAAYTINNVNTNPACTHDPVNHVLP
jgi:prepilin-type N-terminal cleavage/methylation domain-containing protein